MVPCAAVLEWRTVEVNKNVKWLPVLSVALLALELLLECGIDYHSCSPMYFYGYFCYKIFEGLLRNFMPCLLYFPSHRFFALLSAIQKCRRSQNLKICVNCRMLRSGDVCLTCLITTITTIYHFLIFL